ncbi:MAG: NAD(P)H-dependent oxidoreductase [Candidatus Tyloplasma litorale]|nr:MAG: NAD(P)H-dependent oxidoreductase [Mycoplasmatales bacterium]
MNNDIYEKLYTIAKKRRAIKIYDETKDISTDDLYKIFKFTNSSPSSMGIEAWRVLNIKRGNLKKEISNVFESYNIQRVDQASVISIFIVKKEEWFNPNNSILFERLKRKLNVIQPKIDENKIKEMVLNSLKHIQETYVENNKIDATEWAKKQSYIAMGYMMLAAQSLNISTTPIEGFKEELLNEFLLNKNLIDENETTSVAVAMGYSDSEKNEPIIGKEQIRIDVDDQFKIIE